MATIARKYFCNQHYEIDEKTQTIRLLPDFHAQLLNKKLAYNKGFKKVGGSSVGGFLVPDRFNTPFAAFCNIANIGLPVLDEKYVNAGRIIEPMVISAIAQQTKKAVKTFPAEKYNFDYFADKDEIIGGVPDGYIEENNTVLEIKTTNEKNYQDWLTNGAPLNYRKQAAQYAYLMAAARFSIVAIFLKNEDYNDPQNLPINQRIIRNWTYPIDKAEVESDIAKIKTIYKQWTTSGISPKYHLSNDADTIEWLKCQNLTEWRELERKWIASGKYKV